MKAAALIGALTVSLFTIFMLSLTLPGANSHHVVFEEIGQMAGALSYIHEVVPINRCLSTYQAYSTLLLISRAKSSL